MGVAAPGFTPAEWASIMVQERHSNGAQDFFRSQRMIVGD
jgi:hypothetical protein